MKKIVVVFISILLLLFCSIFYIVNSNNKYTKNMINSIYNNTNIKNIKYLNKSNNYYIVKNKERIYVLDYKYNIIIEENISNIKESKLDLVYKNKRLLYEKVKDKKYIYYDIYTLKEVETIAIGGV